MQTTGVFRQYLDGEFKRRCRVNSSYSLRSYARQLGLEPSYLSKVLRGQRSVTPAFMQRVGPKLGFRATELEGLAVSDALYRPLELSQFQVIADWQHYAILELMNIADFKPDFGYVARKLGINVDEARAAVERLATAGLLDVRADGTWVNVSGSNTTVNHAFSSLAFRQLQKQYLGQAIEALDEVPIEQRDQSAMTFAMDSKLMVEAKRRIREFRRELVAYLEQNSPQKDRVYQITLSLFPVSAIDEENA